VVRQLRLSDQAEFKREWTTTIPTLFLVEPNGTVVDASVGYYPKIDADLLRPAGRLDSLIRHFKRNDE
jgi:hypothetical protein